MSEAAELEKFAAEIAKWRRDVGVVAGHAVEDRTIELYRLWKATATRASGDLARSIRYDTAGRFSGGKYARRVYSDDPAALAQEFGTSTQSPNPALQQHIVPVFNRMQSDIENNLPGRPT